jgi:hypothetical protein
MRKVHWLELTTEEFAALDPEKTIAVLPIAGDRAARAALLRSRPTPSSARA